MRFEVVPALLVACEATSPGAWAVASGARDLSWRHVGQVRLQSGFEHDYGDTPLSLRSFRMRRCADRSVELHVAVDFQVRLALGSEKPSGTERIRYSMRDDGTGSLPAAISAWAGETVILRCDAEALRREPVLTCTSSIGHVASFDLVATGSLRGNGWSGDCHTSGAEAEAA